MLTEQDMELASKRCPEITDLYKECMATTPYGRAPMRCRGLRFQVTDCVTDHPFYKTLLSDMKNSTAEERTAIIEKLKERAKTKV